MKRGPIAMVLASALGLGCSSRDAVVESSAAHHTEHACTATEAAPGRPQVYFAPFDEVQAEALCVLDTADEEVLVAHYNIRQQAYLDKLVQLAARGVWVKVAVDQSNAVEDYNVGDDFLEEHGIQVVRTRPSSSAIMHLKVAVIDGDYAMTGSFNWNGTAAQANDENMLVLRDAAVIERYRDQVLEVLGEKTREADGGVVDERYRLHFSPDEPLDGIIEELIDGAAESVDVAMFTFTRSNIANALIRAVTERGVRVRVVMEQKQTGLTDIDERLAALGATLVRGANEVGAFSAMHQKYAVIDGRTVISGATNWTSAGTRSNEEDLLVIDDAAVASRYHENFGDLLSIYGGIDAADIAYPTRPGVLFHAVHSDTGWGDYLVVTGDHPALGRWDPWAAPVMDTSSSMFPSWTAQVRVEPGTRIEYKFVHITAAGEVRWEPGPNRVLEVGRRSAVISGPTATPAGAGPLTSSRDQALRAKPIG